MNRFLVIAALMLCSALVFSADEKKSLTFDQFCEGIDPMKNTALGVKTFWEKSKFKRFTWTGKVHDVKGGRGRAIVWVANDKRIAYKGYNIICNTFDMAGAGELKPGQTIKFTGVPQKFTAKKGRPIVVTMGEVTFIKDNK